MIGIYKITNKIYEVLYGRQKTTGGYIWKFI